MAVRLGVAVGVGVFVGVNVEVAVGVGEGVRVMVGVGVGVPWIICWIEPQACILIPSTMITSNFSIS